MFERFGEFDSYKELNEAAEGQFNEGDEESLRILAAENGIRRKSWICICREKYRNCVMP